MSGLLISWGEIYPGCEERALRLFSEVVAYYGKLIEEGRMGAFEPFLLSAHGGGLRGFMIVRGTPDQIAAVSREDEFRSYTIRAEMLMKDVGVTELFFGADLGHILELFEHQIGALA
jgi:hypothetical protein